MTEVWKNITLESALAELGEAGGRLVEAGFCEGAAGNLSRLLPGGIDPQPLFPQSEIIALPLPAPELAGRLILVSGSGCRLRDLRRDPRSNLGALIVMADGERGELFTAPSRRFPRLTSEFNTHLALHRQRAQTGGVVAHAVAHAQPPYLTFLSHIPRYQDESFLNQRLLRWQPEMVLQFPHGIGLAPFCVPGTAEMTAATLTAMEDRRLAVWARHGVIARAETSLGEAVDLIEYAEAAARAEWLNLAAGEPADGLSQAELKAIQD